MLKFERHRLAAQVAPGVQPYVEAFAQRYGALPTGYWEDEYVLGFVPAMAGLIVKALTRGQIGERDALAVVRECLDNITGGHGGDILGRVERLALTQSPEFVSGARAAGKVIGFSAGQLPADDADLQRARKAAGIAPAAPHRTPELFAATATALVNLLFYDPVNQRLMAGTALPETDSTAGSDTLDSEITPDGSVTVRF